MKLHRPSLGQYHFDMFVNIKIPTQIFEGITWVDLVAGAAALGVLFGLLLAKVGGFGGYFPIF